MKPEAVTNNAELYAKARRTITRVEVDGVKMRAAIEAHLKQSVPALADASFCPRGWMFNHAHFLDPVVDALLGECQGEGTAYIRARWDAENALGFKFKLTSNGHNAWIVPLEITKAAPFGPYKPSQPATANVEIPFDVLVDVIDHIFKDAKEVRVCWSW